MRFLLLFTLACATVQGPPVARRQPKDVTVHGDTRIDDYFWLREKDTPEVLDYLRAEAAYTAAQSQPLLPLRDKLYAELVSRMQETDSAPPYRDGEWLYYSRTEKGLQYPIQCRRKSAEAPEQVLLDLNQLGQGKKFISLGGMRPSDDGNLLAFSTDETGFRQYVLHVRDLRTGADGPERIDRVDSFVWGSDGKTLYYVVEDPVAKRAYQLYRHVLGATTDQLLYEEKDELFYLRVLRSRDRSTVFVLSYSHTATEESWFGAGEAQPVLKVIEPRSKDHEYFADKRGELFYIVTNSTGRNFRLVTAPVSAPGRAAWRELIPHRDDVMLEDLDLFKDHLVLHERAKGLPQLTVIDLRSGAQHRIEFPEPAYDVGGDRNEVFDSHVYRFAYTSLITPRTIVDYDLDSRARTVLKVQPVPGYDPGKYEVERITARAADGVEVPISLVHLKGAPRDGSGALWLYAYGAYGNSMDAEFDSTVFSVVDRGVTFAIAHVRGGGELGKKWHDQGRMLNKRNTFTDFISCAEHLIKAGYVAPHRIVIEGGSAGGLTIGAVLNLRPELFRAAVVEVPFVDVINTMLDETLPLTVTEFEEWGNPKVKSEYDVIRTYSPYDNIAARDYPAMLVKSSYNDSQVMYWEPAKYVARLRALKTDHNPLLFDIKMDPAGHGGASGRYDRLKDAAFNEAFALRQLGVAK